MIMLMQNNITPDIGKTYEVTFKDYGTNRFAWNVMSRQGEACWRLGLEPTITFDLRTGDSVLCIQTGFVLVELPHQTIVDYDLKYEARPIRSEMEAESCAAVDIYLHERGVIALARHCIRYASRCVPGNKLEEEKEEGTP